MRKYINKILRESLYKRLLKEDIDFNLFFMNIKQMIEQLTKISSFLVRNTIDKSLVDKINEAQSIISDVHQTLYVGSKMYGYGGLLNFRKKINENIKIPKLVTTIRETIKQLKDILFLSKGEINNLLNNGYEKEYNDIIKTKDIINEVYEFIYGNGSVKNVVKTDEPKIKKVKTDLNLFDEPFDINITGNYGDDGWHTYRSSGVEINDIRYKADKAKGIFFEENVQNNKKVFTLIDGSTKDHVKRPGAHTISLVFDENTSKTLGDVKQQLLDINKEISKFKGRRRVFKGKESIDNNAFRIGATKYILKFIDDYVKKK